MAKAHGLLPEVAVEFRTASSYASLIGQTNCWLVLQSVQLGGHSKDTPPALSPLVLMPKRVNRAITRDKCPTTSPGLRHDRLPLRVGVCGHCRSHVAR